MRSMASTSSFYHKLLFHLLYFHQNFSSTVVCAPRKIRAFVRYTKPARILYKTYDAYVLWDPSADPD